MGKLILVIILAVGGWYAYQWMSAGDGDSTDSSGDDNTGAADLASLLACWGPAVTGCECFDANDDGGVGAADLAQLLASWGACP